MRRSFRRTRAELTGGRPLSIEELEVLDRLERRLDAELAHELADLEHRVDLARDAGAGQASGPEELGP